MTGTPLGRSKNELRQWGRKAAPPTAEELKRASLAVCEILRARPEFQNAGRIASFIALPWEVDLKSLWFESKSRFVFPSVNRVTHSLDFFSIENWEALKKGYSGILEPRAIDTLKYQAWALTDLVLVPGSVFDVYGGRIGSGKGFYDRFLATIPSQKWGVLYLAQILTEKLTLDKTDVRMHAIVSQAGWMKVR